MHEAVIIDVVRTATGRGKPGGALSGTHPVDVLAMTLQALFERTVSTPARSTTSSAAASPRSASSRGT